MSAINKKYVNTNDSTDIVTIDEIFRRYTSIQDTFEGFEDYVNNSFKDDAGFEEYKELEEKKIDIEDLFPDWYGLKVPETSSHKIKIEYGKYGEYLELSLFHSEDQGDDEWHFNIFECNIKGDIIRQHSVNATRFNDTLMPFKEEY